MTDAQLEFAPASARASPKREFAHASPGSFRLSGESDSRWRDLMFSATSVAILSSIRLPHFRTPLFVFFALLIALTCYRSMARIRLSGRLFVAPLAIFLAIHIASAFRSGRSNGVVFSIQAISDSIFVLAFTLRYSQVTMGRYLKYTGIGMTALMLFVVAWHVRHHHFVTYKYITDSKAVFDVLPIMMLVMKLSKDPRSRRLFPFVVPFFIFIILASGERKAYILLVALAPFFLNWRSPVTYLVPLILGATVPVLLAVGQSSYEGKYISRQLDTLSQLGQGRIVQTHSNDERSWAVSYALQVFASNPVFGVGTNNFQVVMTQRYGKGMGTHNEWLRVLAENGFVGLFFYVATVAYGFIGLFRKKTWARVRSANEKLIAAALFLTFVVYLSLEALDFIVIMAFLFTPMVQFLRLDPNDKLRKPRLTGVRLGSPELSTRRIRSTKGRRPLGLPAGGRPSSAPALCVSSSAVDPSR